MCSTLWSELHLTSQEHKCPNCSYKEMERQRVHPLPSLEVLEVGFEPGGWPSKLLLFKLYPRPPRVQAQQSVNSSRTWPGHTDSQLCSWDPAGPLPSTVLHCFSLPSAVSPWSPVHQSRVGNSEAAGLNVSFRCMYADVRRGTAGLKLRPFLLKRHGGSGGICQSWAGRSLTFKRVTSLGCVERLSCSYIWRVGS